MIRKIAAPAAACILFALAPPARGLDGLSLEIGRGDDRTNLLRVAVQDRWREQLAAARDWRLAGYWELSAAAWDNHDESAADLGLTPVFRVERESLYVEAAIGFHLVSRRISGARVFSTAFQFGDHLGAGMRFGPGGRYDVGMRLQHISNGGLRRPNPGINFVLLRLQYSFSAD
jgi:lipid A 3-O-deacylase